MSSPKKSIPKPVASSINTASLNQVKTEKTLLQRLTSGYVPYIILMVLSFVLYGNILHHQYALDDEIVICKNEAVLKGLAGTSDIFTKDMFASFYSQNNASAQLSGGRYRPLSVFSFALEQQFIGTHPDGHLENNSWDTNENGQPDAEEDLNADGVYDQKDAFAKGFTLRHFDNVLFYGLACCALFLFLSKVVFKKQPIVALVATLLFTAHPIHTEVVANVKSRDEIFSLLFIMLSLYFAHCYETQRKVKFLVFTLLTFFAALLSKEYGVLLLVWIPLSLYLFSGAPFKLKQYTGLFVGMIAVFGIYYMLRSGVSAGGSSAIQDKELMNNPYLLATASQAWATKLFVWLKYFLLCLIPLHLSSDYGYNSIAYKGFGDIEVWMAILLFIAMVTGGVIALIKKHWMAFALSFYVLTLLLVCNLFFNVGATMGERLAFHASVGFCMLLGAGIVWLSSKMKSGTLVWIILIPVILLYSIKTIDRNAAWKNNNTLALADVETMPNSALLNSNAARTYIEQSEWPENKGHEREKLEKGLGYGLKAIHIHGKMAAAYINTGLVYAKLQRFDSSLYCFDKAFEILPHSPEKVACYNFLADQIYTKGHDLGAQQKWSEGIVLFNKAIALNPNVARYWYDLGGYLYNTQNFTQAKQAWTKAYELNPKDPDIMKVQGILK